MATQRYTVDVLEELSRTEDAAHASGDRGIMALGVRKDVAAALAGADGDYQPPIFDMFGRKHVAAVLKPFDAAGHFRVNHRCALVNAQAANSRLFELRNSSASNLIVLTQLIIRWLQTGAHTAAIEDSLDVFKVTGFTVVDTTNTVTPVASKARTSMAASGAVIRGVTVAGASAGMTGGTLTQDSSAIGQLPQWLTAAQPTGSVVPAVFTDNFDDNAGTHPIVLAQDEGIIVENRVLLGAAAASSVYIDLSWAEATAF